MNILLVTPPTVQINTPYPATPYLTAFLRSLGHQVVQRDMGLDLALRIFSRQGLERVRTAILARGESVRSHDSVDFFLEAFDEYVSCVEPVVAFLQGRDDTIALRLSNLSLVPQGPRFMVLEEHPEVLDHYGTMGDRDRAKYIAGLFLFDLADAIRDGVDSRYEFARYGEALASSMPSFSPLLESLRSAPTLVDEIVAEIFADYIGEFRPQLLGLSCPFPGTVYGAFRVAQLTRQTDPTCKIVLGGGYVNTELRELSDPRVFEYIDYLTYDDGERPLQCLIEHLAGKRAQTGLLRTKLLQNGVVHWVSNDNERDIPFKNIPAPTYEGLNLDRYLPTLAVANPVQRLWFDFQWIKLILAHGCYWKKCTFCDIHLDYIKRFEPAQVNQLVQNIKTLIQETGRRGFHFVDEAAPPALLKALSEKLIRERVQITWWCNVRFDPQFTPGMAQLMAQAGCVAVTGGLEVASPRLLEKMKKGVSIEQVARVTKAMADAGILVHAYLIYGFPTQTAQETVDALEVVRQLFAEGCIQSGFWHRFVATAHSPIGRAPQDHDLELVPEQIPQEGIFSRNSLQFYDPQADTLESVGQGLRDAIYNYMHGQGFAKRPSAWFTNRMPKVSISRTVIRDALKLQQY